MKETVTIYTQSSKLINSTRIVYDFSGRKTRKCHLPLVHILNQPSRLNLFQNL